MPLPQFQTNIPQLRREPPRTPGWSGRLLMFSSTMFFVSVALYAGLRFGYQPFLEGRVRNLDAEIKKFSQQIPAETQVEIANFYAQLTNIKKLLAGHTAATPLLAMLEAKTLPAVRYTRAAADVAAGKVVLTGEARSGEDVGTQARVFESQPLVKQVLVNRASADQAGTWSFEITITFDPAFFGAAASFSS